MTRLRALKSEREGAAGSPVGGEITAATYASFAPYVRGKLAQYGVREADLPDLCHEVFLIVHHKIDLLPAVDRVDLWLREICRRVSAGYRRRCGHKLEVLGSEVDDDLEAQLSSVPSEAEAEAGSDRREQLALVRRALHRLDVESRDLLALHDVGEMPLTELAKLVAHDRKTVRKRLETARRRVGRLVSSGDEQNRAGEGGRVTPAEPPSITVGVAKGREQGCAEQLEIVHVTPNRKVGAVGNVALGTWAGVISPEIVDTVFYLAPTTLERCGGELVYLAMIEPTLVPPSLLARQRIVEALEVVGPYIGAFATVLLGGTSAISEPILRGMMLLARPRFPIRFFTGLEAAADWLCAGYARGPQGPLTPAALCAAAERLRAARCI